MRFSALVVVCLVPLLMTTGYPVTAKGLDQRIDREQQQVVPHPLVGTWDLSTAGAPAGHAELEGMFTFLADGTIFVVFESRPTGSGSAEALWWGEGTWVAENNATARYTIAWRTRDDMARTNGTITFDGTFVVRDDGATFADDRRHTMVTLRDVNGTVLDVWFADDTGLTTGRRIQVG